MSEENKDLFINLKDTTSVKFVIEITKEIGHTMAKDFINLQRGKHYFIPVDKEISLKDHTFFKINPQLIDLIDVRNVDNGFATVIPLMHNVQLLHNNKLGTLI